MDEAQSILTSYEVIFHPFLKLSLPLWVPVYSSLTSGRVMSIQNKKKVHGQLLVTFSTNHTILLQCTPMFAMYPYDLYTISASQSVSHGLRYILFTTSIHFSTIWCPCLRTYVLAYTRTYILAYTQLVCIHTYLPMMNFSIFLICKASCVTFHCYCPNNWLPCNCDTICVNIVKGNWIPYANYILKEQSTHDEAKLCAACLHLNALYE